MQQLLAHLQGQMFNASALGRALGGASHTTVARFVNAKTARSALLGRARLQPCKAMTRPC